MSSSPGIELQEPVDVVYISIETAIALASVLGNVLVVLVVFANRALRNTTFFFVVSLAVADIAVGLLVIPLAIIISLGLQTQFYTCLFLSCLLLTITQSSILSLLAIAIDRYLRVKIPIKYSSVVTQERAWAGVGLCWLLSFLTGMVPMTGWNNRDAQMNLSDSRDMPCTFMGVMRMDYMVYFNFFGCVVVPLTVMTSLYVEIFRVIRKQLNSRAEATCDAERYYQKELRLAKSLALVVFLFILCWMPIHIMNCISFFCKDCKIPTVAMNVGIFMSHVNSAVNPMVYAFRIKRFQLTLIEITSRCMLCKRSQPTLCATSMAAMTETAFTRKTSKAAFTGKTNTAAMTEKTMTEKTMTEKTMTEKTMTEKTMTEKTNTAAMTDKTNTAAMTEKTNGNL